MVFGEAKLVIKNKNQTFFHNNKNNNRKKEVETGTSSVSASLLLFQTRCRFDYAVLRA